MKLFMKNKIKFLAVSILSVFVFSACSQLIPPSSEPEKISYIEDGTVSVVGNISFSDKGRSAVTTGDFINAKYKFLISFVRDATDVAPAKTYDIYRTDRTSFNQTFEYGKYTVSVKVKDENGKDVVTYEPTIYFNGETIDYYTDQFIISENTIKTDGSDNTLKIIISPDTTCDGTGKISLLVYTTSDKINAISYTLSRNTTEKVEITGTDGNPTTVDSGCSYRATGSATFKSSSGSAEKYAYINIEKITKNSSADDSETSINLPNGIYELVINFQNSLQEGETAPPPNTLYTAYLSVNVFAGMVTNSYFNDGSGMFKKEGSNPTKLCITDDDIAAQNQSLDYYVLGTDSSSTIWGIGNDSNDGNSINNPLATLQTAIDKIIVANSAYTGDESARPEYRIFVKGTVKPRADTGSTGATTYKNGEISAGDTPLKLKIIGAGSDATIDSKVSDNGDISFEKMFVVSGSKVNLTLENLTLQYGENTNGGAICNNNATITLNNCTVKNNEATNFGGAIYNHGTLTLQNTTLTNNYAINSDNVSQGSGIYNDNVLILSNGTSISNDADRSTSTGSYDIFPDSIYLASCDTEGDKTTGVITVDGNITLGNKIYVTGNGCRINAATTGNCKITRATGVAGIENTEMIEVPAGISLSINVDDNEKEITNPLILDANRNNNNEFAPIIRVNGTKSSGYSSSTTYTPSVLNLNYCNLMNNNRAAYQVDGNNGVIELVQIAAELETENMSSAVLNNCKISNCSSIFNDAIDGTTTYCPNLYVSAYNVTLKDTIFDDKSESYDVYLNYNYSATSSYTFTLDGAVYDTGSYPDYNTKPLKIQLADSYSYTSNSSPLVLNSSYNDNESMVDLYINQITSDALSEIVICDVSAFNKVPNSITVYEKDPSTSTVIPGKITSEGKVIHSNISNATEYLAAVNYINAGAYNMNITLTENIDLSSVTECCVIGTTYDKAYQGTFNGNGKTVKISTTSALKNETEGDTKVYAAGIVGYLGESGVIENVIIDSDNTLEIDSVGSSDTTPHNWYCFGGICFGNLGTIRNCENRANVTINASEDMGGICTINFGTVINCINKGNLTNTACPSWSDSSFQFLGGIAGGNGYGCYHLVTVASAPFKDLVGKKQGKIINCVNLGTLELSDPGSNENDSIIGAITAYNYKDSSIENCYWVENCVTRGDAQNSCVAYHDISSESGYDANLGSVTGCGTFTLDYNMIKYDDTKPEDTTANTTITAGTTNNCDTDQTLSYSGILYTAVNGYVTAYGSTYSLKPWTITAGQLGINFTE